MNQEVARKNSIIQSNHSTVNSSEKRGYSVMQRVKTIQQPCHGLIDPADLDCTPFDDGIVLGNENIPAYVVGTAVDYLSRMMLGATPAEAFEISLFGAKIAGLLDLAREQLDKITGLDDTSIASACRLVTFDSYYRAGHPPQDDPSDINADAQTCENIRTMVQRSTTFFGEYVPIVNSAPVFTGGYTDIISSGDGDYLSIDTIWDMKVSRSPPDEQNTLQLAIYFYMGKHSALSDYDDITSIGIFNPRLNVAYKLDMRPVPEEVKTVICRDIIGYQD